MLKANKDRLDSVGQVADTTECKRAGDLLIWPQQSSRENSLIPK